MSETQKWLTSISGAIVGTVVVLLFFMLLTLKRNVDFNTDFSVAPEVVTIMLSDLKAEKEDLELPEQKKDEKRFINTDSNVDVREAPKNASFESDRNTIATTRFKPDKTLPQEAGPTTIGQRQSPGLELRDQDYREGEYSAVPPAIVAKLVEPADLYAKPEDVDKQDREVDAPLEREADKQTEVESENRSENPMPASSVEDLLQVGSGAKPSNFDGSRNRDTPKNVVDSAGPQRPASSKVNTESLKQAERELEQIKRQLTMGAFSSSFQEQTRQSNRNGDISNIGEGSVNAESTAVGAYKKTVSNAIAKKWHEYRQASGVANPGYLRVNFSVNKQGQVRNLIIRTNEADTTLTEFSLKAIRNAKIPPMPIQVLNDLGSAGLKMNYDISIY